MFSRALAWTATAAGLVLIARPAAAMRSRASCAPLRRLALACAADRGASVVTTQLP